MELEELEKLYTSPERFPLTTQEGLSFSKQAMIDAFNFDSLQEGIDNGEELSDEQRARFKELSEKKALIAQIIALRDSQ